MVADDATWSAEVQARAFGHCERYGWHAGCLGRSSDAHHVRGKKAHPELRYVVANGVALCRPGHDDAHARVDEFREWFQRERPGDYQTITAVPDAA